MKFVRKAVKNGLKDTLTIKSEIIFAYFCVSVFLCIFFKQKNIFLVNTVLASTPTTLPPRPNPLTLVRKKKLKAPLRLFRLMEEGITCIEESERKDSKNQNFAILIELRRKKSNFFNNLVFLLVIRYNHFQK